MVCYTPTVSGIITHYAWYPIHRVDAAILLFYALFVNLYDSWAILLSITVELLTN